MMRAIIIKELRENARWAVLMLLAVAALMAAALYKDASTGLSLVGPMLQMATIFAFPAVGFALGLLQILQDYRRDRWSFIIHRPMSRTRIFFAKVIAGVILYLVATGIPLAITILWVSIPGHVEGPVEWHMALPRIADLIGGLMWYAAGLLVGARHARWIGSRLMPVGIALIASGLAFAGAINFAEAVLWPFAALVILLPASWGAFVSGGEYEPQPLISRLFQTLSIAPGVGIIFGLACGLFYSSLGFVLHLNERSTSYGYTLDSEGKVIRMAYSPDGRERATDLQWRSLSDQQIDEWRQHPLAGGYIFLLGRGDALSPDGRRYWRFQNPERYLSRLDQTWYYVVQWQSIVGIHDYHLMGSIGPDGFSPNLAQSNRFQERLDTRETMGFSWLMASATTAYRVDFIRRNVKQIFVTYPNDPIVGTTAFEENPRNSLRPASGPSSSIYLVIATRSTLRLYRDNSNVCQIPLEPNWRQYSSLFIGRTTDGRFILHYIYPMGEMGSLPLEQVVEADSSGKIIQRMELPALPDEPSHEPWWFRELSAVVMPPGFFLIKMIAEREYISSWGTWTAGTACAGLTLLLFRRYVTGRGARILWMILNLLLGIPGILLLLSLRQCVALVRCPSCGKWRIVARDQCEHCGAEFSKPPMEGIEVFEMAE